MIKPDFIVTSLIRISIERDVLLKHVKDQGDCKNLELWYTFDCYLNPPIKPLDLLELQKTSNLVFQFKLDISGDDDLTKQYHYLEKLNGHDFEVVNFKIMNAYDAFTEVIIQAIGIN